MLLGFLLLPGERRADEAPPRGDSSEAMLAAVARASWPRFRGPNGSGVAIDGELPVHFGPTNQVIWKTPLPSGASSPCLWGDRIFLTGYDGAKLETLCLDRRTGQVAWRRTAPATAIEKVTSMGSPAASTPVTDGRRVYVYFGSFGLLSYDGDGREEWRKPLPTPVTQHGTGTSPILEGDLLLLVSDQDVDAYVLAVNRNTGQTVWKTERPGCRRGFCTPLIWRDAGEPVLIVPGTLRVVAYRLTDGQPLWRVDGLPNEMCASPALGAGLLFVSGWTPGAGETKFPSFQSLLEQADADKNGSLSRAEAPPGPAQQHFPYIDANKDGQITRAEWEAMAEIFAKSTNALLAIRPGGAGDVTTTHLAWRETRGLPYVPSPLFYRDRLYLVKNGGLISCFNATNGVASYVEQKLGAAGDYYASPVAANGKICVASRRGVLTVFEAGDVLKVLAQNELGETTLATPAVSGHCLYVRTQDHLFAFGE